MLSAGTPEDPCNGRCDSPMRARDQDGRLHSIVKVLGGSGCARICGTSRMTGMTGMTGMSLLLLLCTSTYIVGLLHSMYEVLLYYVHSKSALGRLNHPTCILDPPGLTHSHGSTT